MKQTSNKLHKDSRGTMNCENQSLKSGRRQKYWYGLIGYGLMVYDNR